MHTTNTAKKLVIFDLDGTLIDSVPDLAAAVNAALQSFGASSATVDLVRSWVGNGSLVLMERALQWANLEQAQLAAAHERFLTAYADATGVHTLPYDGVLTGLNRLVQQGFVLAIATNKPKQFLPDLLTQFGWENTFAMVVGGDSLPNKKPAPDQLLHIADTLQIGIEQCVMVGDSKNDILAGKAAGMTTVAVRYGYNYDEPIDVSEPDVAFDAFEQVVQYLLADG